MDRGGSSPKGAQQLHTVRLPWRRELAKVLPTAEGRTLPSSKMLLLRRSRAEHELAVFDKVPQSILLWPLVIRLEKRGKGHDRLSAAGSLIRRVPDEQPLFIIFCEFPLVPI